MAGWNYYGSSGQTPRSTEVGSMSPDSSFEAKTYRKVDLRLIPFLFLCYILAYLDRVNVGFAKLQMLKALSLSDAAFATGAGIFFIGYFIFEVPSNVALKKFGARRWIARIMISWGIVSACMIFVKGAVSFNALRFLLGVVEAGFFPGVIFYLTLWYPSRLRATRTAWFCAAIADSGDIGNPVSGWIMDPFSGVRGLAGWQWLFLAEGIPSVIVGIWVIFYLNSNIEEAKWLTAEEKAVLANNLVTEEKDKTEYRLIDAFKSVTVWVLCVIYFTLMIGLYGIAFWLPTIVKAFGIKGYLGVGLITAIPYGVAVIGMILLSHHSDQTGERRLHYVWTASAGAAGLVLSGVFAANPVLAIIFLSIGTLGVIGSMPLFWPLPSAFLTGTAAAAGIGIVNSVGNLGGYIGPNVPVWAKLISSDRSAALYIIAAILLIGALITFFFVPKNLRVRVGAAEPVVPRTVTP
ncbi:MAG: MFS transporter [Candidatus Korobacteraceae bacterium]